MQSKQFTLLEGDTPTVGKKKKKEDTKITAGQSSHEEHYLNKVAKQCSARDWFVTQEINELILCFKTDTGNEDDVIIANTYKNN